MSVIRLILLDSRATVSGLIPSRSLAVVLWALSQGADNRESFWAKATEIDTELESYFRHHQDPEPLLEGHGDGLLVVNWEHRCIESFQEYQTLRREGVAQVHNGLHRIEGESRPYRLGDDWHLVDHQFEES